MTANLQQADGTLETSGGRDVLRYERRLSHPVERVWRAITQPEEIVHWLGEVELEPVEGGTVVLRWLNTPEETVARGTVTAFDPPRALELDTDVHGVLRWELEADGDAWPLDLHGVVSGKGRVDPAQPPGGLAHPPRPPDGRPRGASAGLAAMDGRAAATLAGAPRPYAARVTD